ncbi:MULTISPECIES: ribosomal protein L7/L12 [unclassified Streptomyces]|uniref:ribosomal protein L7/L12 n=1 Tax=unclassified Streptomyces TaxID=2593676 RepID=UPI001F039996|nr:MULTISPECIES: ribosomal protein L7/L12 [unclassified Streptomyces]MCH0562657.1 ribosomal protein L7/L12 [Streptomyces sp. MUM 2J]MCH0567833.1 ribosomal protein L7/L12 [Streptomyces sp. MUM 136J]
MGIVELLLVLGLFAGIWSVQSRLSGMDRRLVRMERQLALIADRLGLEEPDGQRAQRERVEALVREGKQVAAIRAYREMTGAGLKEAKDAVDRMV